jgi:hypothetical protein
VWAGEIACMAGVWVMESFAKYLLLVFLWVFGSQLYCFAASLKGVQRQEGCRNLGILYITAGIVSLVFREMLFAVSGLMLIMLGLRLVSYGLDRIDKKTFIDRYKED